METIAKLSGSSAAHAVNIARYPFDAFHDRDSRSPGVEDYYMKSDVPNRWIGSGLEAIGLQKDGEVNEKALVKLLQGFDPRTGDKLVQNAGQKRVMAYDLTFSAPKSVSALWALADQDTRAQIEAAHEAAHQRAIQFIERHAAFSSRGKGRSAADQAKLIVASFRHATSREMDPDLHNHDMLLNVVVRPDGSTGAIRAKDLFQWKMTSGAIYRAELAAELQHIGFAVERDREFFKLTGVSDQLCDQWSKRRQQIVGALDNPAARGKEAAKARDAANKETRAPKKEITQQHLDQRWQQEAQELGITRESLMESVRQAAAAQAEAQAAEPAAMADHANIRVKLTEHDSVFRDKDVFRAIAVEAQGHLNADQIETYFDRLLKDREMVTMRSQADESQVAYSTREMVLVEREIIQSAARRAAETTPELTPAGVDRALADFADRKGFALSDEQQAFVRALCQQAGGIRVGVGDAGTGKSTTMSVIKSAYESAGYTVLGCAPSGKAAAELQGSTAINSVTIHKLLRQLDPWTDDQNRHHDPAVVLTNRSVIVVDEAGMVDSRVMGRLLARAEAAGSRLIMIGDHKQLAAVGPGGVFRHLVDLTTAPRLTEIHRQQDTEHQTAIQQFSRGEVAQALQYYVDNNLLHLADNQPQAVAQCVSKWSEHYDRFKADAVIMFAPTNAAVADLNSAAREWMQQHHQLCNPVEFQTRDHLGKSTGKLQIAGGDRLLLKRNAKEFDGKNGDLCTVMQIDRDRQGQVRIHAKLDRTGQVIQFTEDTYSQVRLGYAVTVHASQGMTVDHAAALAPNGRQSTYVTMSRARYSTDLVLTRSQVDEMAATLEPTAAMIDFATSIAERQQIELPTDFETSFSACREFLNQHADHQLGGVRERGQLDEVKDVISAMARAQDKETTLEYQTDRDLEKEIAQEQAETAAPLATPAPAQDEEYEMEMEPEPEDLLPAHHHFVLRH